MALNSSGQISISNICTEKKVPLSGASLTTLSTIDINSTSIAKPNSVAPHSISEFYNYNHTFIAPSITITNYSAGKLYFTLKGTGYSTSALTIKSSSTSSSGPWGSDTSGSISPRSVIVPSVTTWYQIQDAITPSILSNVYQYVKTDNTPPPAPYLSGTFNNALRELRLTWNIVTDPSSPVTYIVYNGNYIPDRPTTNSANFFGASISPGKNSWTVRSMDSAGNISDSSNAYIFTAI
ncbi:hypothetical protein OIU80_05625 [Flavobacterium sp. LS1R47]|uniref:Fibronectin type-III domain-containing protein n=1 Tax=Flavobacterium frigoritolerans TaxID=2987686 RepID=A0A9X2ZI05_9FLAO|nr:hypothetical protein [Flavobacterium frigoritolerans]MCV9931756.1 hypothetical protein [Flavobacterium frigoritolerans]